MVQARPVPGNTPRTIRQPNHSASGGRDDYRTEGGEQLDAG